MGMYVSIMHFGFCTPSLGCLRLRSRKAAHAEHDAEREALAHHAKRELAEAARGGCGARVGDPRELLGGGMASKKYLL